MQTQKIVTNDEITVQFGLVFFFFKYFQINLTKHFQGFKKSTKILFASFAFFLNFNYMKSKLTKVKVNDIHIIH